jgi:Tol biopolymer transport system component
MLIRSHQSAFTWLIVMLLAMIWIATPAGRLQAHRSLDTDQHLTADANDTLGVLFYGVQSDETGMFDAANSGYYWMRSDGTDVTLLASWEEIITQADGLLQLESISPDGGQVLYLAQMTDLEATDILSLNLVSGTNTQYTFTADGEASWNPVWSLDGAQFAYLSGDPLGGLASSVRVFDLESNQTHSLFALEDPDSHVEYIAWSADAKGLVILVTYPPGEGGFVQELRAVLVTRDGSEAREIVLPVWTASMKPVLRGASLYVACGVRLYNELCRYDTETGAFKTVVRLTDYVRGAQAIESFDVTPDEQEAIISFTNYTPTTGGQGPPDGKAFTYRIELANGQPYDLSGVYGEARRFLQFTTDLPLTGSPSVPTLSEGGEWLIFVSFRDGIAELYRMRPDGSEVQRLTRTPEIAEDLSAWSPDGQQLAFIARDDPVNSGVLFRKRGFLMGADGGDLRLILDDHIETLFSPPAWSPDGRWILFSVRVEPDQTDIIRIEADSGEIHYLTNDEPSDESPTWSPSGDWIAFSSTRDEDGFKVYVMRPDGSDIRRVVDCGSGRPVWSPDSQWIAFTSTCFGTLGLYRARVDGTGLEQLTDIPVVGMFSWSPDGRWLAFYAEDATLYLVEVETGVVRQFDVEAVAAGRPEWSPDSEWLVFTGEINEQWDLFRVHPDGSHLENLTQNPDTDMLPTWRPDPVLFSN